MRVVVVVIEEVYKPNWKCCLVMRVVVVVKKKCTGQTENTAKWLVIEEKVVYKSNWKCCLLISNRRSSLQVEVKMLLSN